MKYNARSYRNHDLVQRYCRFIDDNTVGLYDDHAETGDFECLTPQRCGSRTSCPHNRMCRRGDAEMRIPDGSDE